MGLSRAPELEANKPVKDKIKTARMLTVISWCTYSFMYLFLMSRISASKAMVGIQTDYYATAGYYNTFSFALARMMATTMYMWFRSKAVADNYRDAVLFTCLVTFIAACHYFASSMRGWRLILHHEPRVQLNHSDCLMDVPPLPIQPILVCRVVSLMPFMSRTRCMSLWGQ